MDIPRQKPRTDRRMVWFGGVAAILLSTAGLAALKPAAPTVERATLWIDTVKRGPMVREVRGNGTLVPENQQFVSALTSGRVDRVLVRPGARVEPGSILLELSNPDVQLEALEAERQLGLAEADLASLATTLESQVLVAASAAAAAKSRLHEAERGVRVAERLQSEGLSSGMEIERARDQVDETRVLAESEQRRLAMLRDSQQAQLRMRRAEVERLRAIARVQRDRVGAMTVRAGVAGVVQELSLQPGQWVNPGQTLARVAGQERLKAVVRVPETQARDLSLGLLARVDTHDGIVKARVSRVDPAVQGGTVVVDLTLEGDLPRGARPDLSVDGTIELERLGNVLHVGRPSEASSESDAYLFRLTADGRHAERVPVKIGRGSADAVEIRAGLREGDRVILSEMNRYDTVPRVRLQ